MTPNYATALQAATAAAGHQNHPKATLYMVATPIGNLADITLRALLVLQLVERIACEDTRHTGQMLRSYGLDKPLLAVHQHNEAEAAHRVIESLALGERVAYVSDAGTPAISDPGARLGAAVRAAGYRVMPIPGASSVVAALSAAGLGGDTAAFSFLGFCDDPTKAIAQHASTAALVFFEAPHRIAKTAQRLGQLGERRITVCRELTKQFESIDTLSCADLADWLQADTNRSRGEFVLVLHPQAAAASTATDDTTKTLGILLKHLPLKGAVAATVELTGQPKNTVYQLALDLRAGGHSAESSTGDEG